MNIISEIQTIIQGLGFFGSNEPITNLIGHILVAFLGAFTVLAPIGVVWILVKWIARLGLYDN